ncbi:hypothetical protein Tco_0747366 [Tanacetum coccineum]|uniref:Tf2-1-like SH3-like domain-containing protein n=1 Tax=Tanacetum coccineum TaxID=301880 RepID=A0ABQ4YTI2_9ASTR
MRKDNWAAQCEAFKQRVVTRRMATCSSQQMERKGDESLYFMDRIWVLLVGSVMDEAHASRYLAAMSKDFWLTAKRALRYLSENEIGITMDLSLNFQVSKVGYNGKEWNSGEDRLRLRWMTYLVVLADAAEGVRDAIGFGGSYQLSIQCALFEALYGRKCRSHVLCAKIGDSSLIGPELGVRGWRDGVLLKVSPWKGVMRFGKKGKLAPRYVGPFEILKRIGTVAYRLRLPEELIGVHDTFHVSNLKKCLGNANFRVPE